MVYNIKKYDNTPLVSVPDNSINTTTTSISLIGRYSVNFGLAMNENFVALLQHFANTSPPPQPIQGQIWFDTMVKCLKVWDGFRWLIASPAFDGNAGTATVAISPTVEVMVMLSDSHIISAVSHQTVVPADLPINVVIADVSYPFAARFPNGLAPGISLATDPNGYKFFGAATTANALTTARTISLGGSLSGNVLFDGSNNVVLNGNLINVLNANVTPGTYTKVTVSSNGLVTNANVLTDSDVFTALGYTPPSQVVVNGAVYGNTSANGTVFTVNVSMSNTGVVSGSYNNVTVGPDGRVTYGQNDNPVPIKSMVLWEDILVPNNWAKCDGQVVLTPAGSITTPNLIPFNIGPTYFIMRVS